jgi:6-pyruvoyltetrahydropterin 2'-reductase
MEWMKRKMSETSEGRNIPIAEQFYSVQGEGPYAGTPSVFLRLAGCNLSCGLTESNISEFEKGQDPESGAEWICDTIDVWRSAERTPTPAELVNEWEARGWLSSLSERAHLVLTGGEPMIKKNQDAFLSLMTELLRRNIVPFVEVETNGTVLPQRDIRPYVNQWNASVKLSNSGMPAEERINSNMISFLKSVHNVQEGQDATFKFVVGPDTDIAEIINFTEEFNIPDSMMTLMPAGQRREQLAESYPYVAEKCKEYGWQFSPRLQVDVWGEVTGV